MIRLEYRSRTGENEVERIIEIDREDNAAELFDKAAPLVFPMEKEDENQKKVFHFKPLINEGQPHELKLPLPLEMQKQLAGLLGKYGLVTVGLKKEAEGGVLSNDVQQVF